MSSEASTTVGLVLGGGLARARRVFLGLVTAPRIARLCCGPAQRVGLPGVDVDQLASTQLAQELSDGLCVELGDRVEFELGAGLVDDQTDQVRKAEDPRAGNWFD